MSELIVNEAPFRRDNHYVPRGYLKRFSASSERVWTYRTLVSHSRVPLWKERSIRGVAYYRHLYTRIAAGRETDEIEKWLDREFEAPAEEALRKATADAQLMPTDWKRLVRFLAAQDVRTPARFIENLQRWHATLPDLMEDTLQNSVRKLEVARRAGEVISIPKAQSGNLLPFRVTTEIEPNQEFGKLKGEIVVGRGLWLFSIHHSLTHTANILHQHRWTILSPPNGLSWFTSDNPVIRLNFHGDGKYDFKGGWGSPGTEILLPLSPRHLLYAKIGQKPPHRGHRMPLAQAEMIRRFIAEHAHRTIFAMSPDVDVAALRPRVVNAPLLREENEQWSRWHEDQTTAERELMGWTET